MFEAFYGLSTNPFRLSPDERFLYVHTSYVKARAYLKYALDRAEGFVMVTGPPGSGKTLLVRDILAELDPNKIEAAHLVTNQLQAEDLLRMLALVFGFHAENFDKASLLTLIQRHVTEQYQAGRRAILIIDDAQNLPAGSLEELRLLSNLQTTDHSLLQIFLIGQEELRDLILGPGMEQFSQRLIATSRIEAMDQRQTREYIEHRLEIAGWRQDPHLDPSIFPLIYRFSQGIPRQVNHIASRLLLFGALEQKHRLQAEDILTIIGELHQEQLLPPLGEEELAAIKAEVKHGAAVTAPPEAAGPEATASTPAPPTEQQETRARDQGDGESGSNEEVPHGPSPVTADAPSPAVGAQSGEAAGAAAMTDSPRPDSMEPPLPEVYPLGLQEIHDFAPLEADEAAPPLAATEDTPQRQPAPSFAEQQPPPVLDQDAPPKTGLLHKSIYTLTALLVLLALLLPRPQDLPALWQEIRRDSLSLLGYGPGGSEATRPAPATGETPTPGPAESGPGSDQEAALRIPESDTHPPTEAAQSLPATGGTTPSQQTDAGSGKRPEATAETREVASPQPELEPQSVEPAQPNSIRAGASAATPAASQPQAGPGGVPADDHTEALVEAAPPRPGAADRPAAKADDNQPSIESTEDLLKAEINADTVIDHQAFPPDNSGQASTYPDRVDLDTGESIPPARPATGDRTDAMASEQLPPAPSSSPEPPARPNPGPSSRPAPDLHETHQILFGFDSSEIDPAFIPTLQDIVNSLKQAPDYSVEIRGYTDASGDPLYNRLLSKRRAKAIADYLVAQGIEQGRILTLGVGPLEKPPGEATESREQRMNKRRVDVRLLAPGQHQGEGPPRP